jgi:hypothetical protein
MLKFFIYFNLIVSALSILMYYLQSKVLINKIKNKLPKTETESSKLSIYTSGLKLIILVMIPLINLLAFYVVFFKWDVIEERFNEEAVKLLNE